LIETINVVTAAEYSCMTSVSKLPDGSGWSGTKRCVSPYVISFRTHQKTISSYPTSRKWPRASSTSTYLSHLRCLLVSLISSYRHCDFARWFSADIFEPI